MPFISACTYCLGKVRVPDKAIGQSLTCPRCACSFTVVPLPTVGRSPSTTPQMGKLVKAPDASELAHNLLVTDAAAESHPEAAVSQAALIAAMTPASAAAMPFRGPAPARDTLTAGHVALLLGGLALLCALFPYGQIPTLVLSGLGAVVGLGGLWLGPDRRGWFGIHAYGPAVSILAFVFAGLWAGDAGGPRPNTVAAAPPDKVHLRFGDKREVVERKPVEPTDGQWVDAGREAVRNDGVVVGVVSVTIEPVKTTLGSGTTTRQAGLVIRLQLLSPGSKKVEFKGWWADGGSPAKLTLAGGGEAVRTWVLESGVEVVGRRLDVYPRLSADEVLVFNIPRGRIPDLKLELPAAAFGGTGTLRFKIPASMVQMSGK